MLLVYTSRKIRHGNVMILKSFKIQRFAPSTRNGVICIKYNINLILHKLSRGTVYMQ